jgi:hypothetical protein
MNAIYNKSFQARLCPAILLAFAGGAYADPPPTNPPDIVLPNVFCFRITDIERVAGDPGANAFNFEFEVLNWTNKPAASVALMSTVGSKAVVGAIPTISGNSIDVNGRGGPTGGSDIGDVIFDPVAIHSGRGRGDIPAATNDWVALGSTAASAIWDASTFGGTPVPFRNLLGAGSTAAACALVPGCFLDASGNPVTTALDTLGDVALDGGPGIVPNPVAPDGSGNVLDGFVLTVDDFEEGEILSLNWFLLDGDGKPIGVVGNGNAFGFGVFNLGRIPVGGALPGPIFVGNTGMAQSNRDFFDTVYQIPNPAEFAGEFGGGITAAFLNPQDNFLNAPINAQFIPEPTPLSLLAWGLLLVGSGRAYRRNAGDKPRLTA